MRWRLGKFVQPPAEVADALKDIFGDGVDVVEVVEHSLLAWLHVRTVATTRRRRIYLRGDAGRFFGDPALMLHEYCHVLKQWESGDLTTLRYTRECLRRGYWNNCFEVEARQFIEANLSRFCTLLKR